MASPAKSVPPLPRLLARLTGARLCFGRPVSANGRTVIPVASVRSAGGGGFGRGGGADDVGGGGGGALEARPVGFIEISSEGTRFEAIDDGRTAMRVVVAASLAVIVAGRVLMRGRRRMPQDALRGARRRGRHAVPPPSPPAPPARRGLLWRAAPVRQLRRGHSSQGS